MGGVVNMNFMRKRSWVEHFTEEEDSVYFKEAREHLVEDDILSTKDDGFMQGYEEGLAEIEDSENSDSNGAGIA